MFSDKDWDMAHAAALADGYNAHQCRDIQGLRYIEYQVNSQRVTKLFSVFNLEKTLQEYGLSPTQRKVILRLVDNVVHDSVDESQID